MVCLEMLQRFLEDMQAQSDGFDVRRTSRFRKLWTILASNIGSRATAFFWSRPRRCRQRFRRCAAAYAILGDDLCATCPRRDEREAAKGDWYYMI